MDLFEAIHTRRSIRKYKDQAVPDEFVKKILAAAMSAPSAGNEQPWEFVVITEKSILLSIPSVHPHAKMAKDAPLAILVCGNLDLEKYPGNWVLDCSAAVQNILLSAHALGLGAVWTGIYPEEDRMKGFSELFSLPASVKPHALIILGYPDQYLPAVDRYKEERVHNDTW